MQQRLTTALALSKQGIDNLKIQLHIVVLLLLIISGCASTSTSTTQSQWVQPGQAVLLAAEAAPKGVPGLFVLQVQATGEDGNFTYLNSELDYRDQRNLTVVVTPSAARQIKSELGVHPIDAFKGKRILVNGVATRTKIFFTANGKATDKYYYQTHVRVTDPAQITVQREG